LIVSLRGSTHLKEAGAALAHGYQAISEDAEKYNKRSLGAGTSR
jgi:hypothetical protein